MFLQTGKGGAINKAYLAYHTNACLKLKSFVSEFLKSMRQVQGKNVIIGKESFEIIKRIVEGAEKYIKIASFLFYDKKICDLLIRKKQDSIEIEVLTTPPEAAESNDLKTIATNIQEKMRKSGIEVIPCDWEVGQPEMTTSTRAGGRIPRWFAMHAKYIITDKCAFITSADITKTFCQEGDWNTHIIYSDSERITLLNRKHEKLKDMFLNTPSPIDPQHIDTTVSPRKLIKGYLFDKIPELTPLQAGFYLLPHEGYGRRIIEKAIQDATEFIYLIFETIYDDEIAQVIMKKLISNPRIDFKIITSPLNKYVQNKAKTRATFVQLVSYGVKIKILKNLRAKMLVTDKVLMNGSFDLVRMGIGIERTIKDLKVLVASTEIMDINTRDDYIREAKEEFLKTFDSCVEEYGLWFSRDAETILRSAGAKQVAGDAKELLGYMIFNEGRKSSNRIKNISLISVEIARVRKHSRPYVKAEDIQKAEQILLLHDRKELNEENIKEVLSISNTKDFLKRLDSILY